jgi:hypothetical protein
MKNVWTLAFVLLLSVSVAVAQSNEADNNSDANVENVDATTSSQEMKKANCGSKAKKAGCCKKKSASAKMGCHGKAQANAACCDKHANAGTKEEEE